MKKTFRKIHLWLSVPFGLIIALICFSGAALVFESEITEMCRHDLYYVQKVEASPLPMDSLLAKVAKALPDSMSIIGVSVTSDPERAYQVNLSPGRRTSIYVDQYTGEIKGKSERIPFFYTMFRMHRWLLDSIKPDGGIFWGKMIVGVSTFMLVFVLISGIVIWWPRTKKILKNSLKITVRKGWRRFWYDLHVAGGMYTLIFLLIMALTGLTWSFSWYRNGFYKVFGAEVPQQSGGHAAGHGKPDGKSGDKSDGKSEGEDRGHGRENGEGREGRGDRSGRAMHRSPYAHWQQVYEELKKTNPDFKTITVSKGSATVSSINYGNTRASDRYKFNPRNGEITEATLYKDADVSGKIRGWIFSVHVGSWGGMCTRILSFIAALFGATLPLTGYYLWFRRLKRRN